MILMAYDERIPDKVWDRVDVDWGTDCWLWAGTRMVTDSGASISRLSSTDIGLPKRPGKQNGKDVMRPYYLNAHAYFYCVSHERPYETGLTLFTTCGTDFCVNPKHKTECNPVENNDFPEEVHNVHGGRRFRRYATPVGRAL